MSGGMRLDNDDIRALPLHMQEQVGVAIANQMAQANPVAGREEKPMLKCDPRAFARCPYNKTCVSVEMAEFPEGSDCHRFNNKVLDMPVTHGDRIRGMDDRELASFLTAITRACADRRCDLCPIGKPDCVTMIHWVRQET